MVLVLFNRNNLDISNGFGNFDRLNFDFRNNFFNILAHMLYSIIVNLVNLFRNELDFFFFYIFHNFLSFGNLLDVFNFFILCLSPLDRVVFDLRFICMRQRATLMFGDVNYRLWLFDVRYDGLFIAGNCAITACESWFPMKIIFVVSISACPFKNAWIEVFALQISKSLKIWIH